MLLVISKITLTFDVDAVGHLRETFVNKYHQIFGSFSSLIFSDRVAC